MKTKRLCSIVIGLIAGLWLPLASIHAATIIDEWTSVKPEPAPPLKPALVDPKNTALLVMDLVKGSCNVQRRPRCVDSIPVIAGLMREAREQGMMVINTVAGSGGVADILPDVAPKTGEVVLTGTVADKFKGTGLEQMLKDKSISTVVTAGTAAQGAVLYTASEAAFRGFKVIVPVDAASSDSLYAEQAVAWLLTNAPGVAKQVTLTKADMIRVD